MYFNMHLYIQNNMLLLFHIVNQTKGHRVTEKIL